MISDGKEFQKIIKFSAYNNLQKYAFRDQKSKLLVEGHYHSGIEKGPLPPLTYQHASIRPLVRHLIPSCF